MITNKVLLDEAFNITESPKRDWKKIIDKNTSNIKKETGINLDVVLENKKIEYKITLTNY